MRPDSVPSYQNKLIGFEARCRKAGLRLTHQRLEIFREVASTYDHPSASTIYKRVQARMPTISLDTVYRTLLTLEDCGFATRIHAFDDEARFDANMIPHQHLACTHCRSIQDVHWEAFEEMDPPVETRKWGDVRSKHVVLKGICKNCLRKGQGKSA